MPIPYTFTHPEAAERFSQANIATHIASLLGKGRLVDTNDFCFTLVEGTEPEADLARAVVYGVFDTMFKGNDYPVLKKIYEEDDPDSEKNSHFILGVDMTAEDPIPVATMGLLYGDSDTPESSVSKTVRDVALPSNPDDPAEEWWGADSDSGDMIELINKDLQPREGLPFGRQPVARDKMIDVATLAAWRQYQGRPAPFALSRALTRALCIHAVNIGRPGIVVITQQQVLEQVFQREFEWAASGINGLPPRTYYNALSSPIHGDAGQYLQRASMPDASPELASMLPSSDEVTRTVHPKITTMPMIDRLVTQ